MVTGCDGGRLLAFGAQVVVLETRRVAFASCSPKGAANEDAPDHAHGPVIPVIVIQPLGVVVPLARGLVAGGVPVLEVTLRTTATLFAL